MKNHISLPLSRSHLSFIGFSVLFMVSLVVGCSDTELAPTAVDIDPNMRELVMAIPAAPLTEKPFVIVEQMPVLIGGLEGIQRNIKYPEIAKKAGVQGRVFLQFVVDIDGNVIDPVVTRGIGAGCDEAAIQALEQAHFIPGVQRNLRVPVKMSIPVTFRLDGPIAAKIPRGVRTLSDSSLPKVRPEDIQIFDSFADVDFDYTVVLGKKSMSGANVSAEYFRTAASKSRGTAIVRGGEVNRDLVKSSLSEFASNPHALIVIRRK